MPSLRLLVIKSPQPAALAAFYTSLGFEFDYHQHGKGPFHYASKETPVTLEIYPLPKGITTADTTTRLGFTVDDVDDLVQRLPAGNIVTMPASTQWGYAAVVQDPDGRKIELVQA